MGTIGDVILRIRADITGLEKGLSDANDTLKARSKDFEDSTKGLKKLASTATDVGAGMTAGITLPALAAAGASISLAEQAQEAADKISSLTNNADDTAKILTTIDDISTHSKFGADQLREAAVTLLQYGYDGKEIPGMLKDIGDAAEGTGKGAAGITSLVEVMGKLNQTGTVTTKDLNNIAAQGIPIYDILAAKYGVSNDKLKDMLNAQDKVATATDNLTNAQKDLTDQEHQLDDIEYDITQTQKKMAKEHDPAKIADYQHHLDDLTYSYKQQQDKIQETKDKIGEYTDESKTKIIDAQTVVDGTLDAMHNKYSGEMAKSADTVSGQLNTSKEELRQAAEDMGTELIPLTVDLLKNLIPIVGAIRDFVTWFKQLPEPVKKSAEGLGLLIVVLGPMITLLGMTANGLIALNAAAVLFTGTGLVGLAAAAAPVLAVIAVIGLLVAAVWWLYNNCAEARTGMNEMWDAMCWEIDTAIKLMQGIIKIGGDIISGNWSAIWTDARDTFSSIWLSIPDTLKPAFETLLGLFKGIADAYNSTVGKITGPIDTSGLQNMINLLNNAGGGHQGDPGSDQGPGYHGGTPTSTGGASSGGGGGHMGPAHQARASGGPVSAGTPYIVGEQGKELFVPGMSGSIIPNNLLGSVLGGSSSSSPMELTIVFEEDGVRKTERTMTIASKRASLRLLH